MHTQATSWSDKESIYRPQTATCSYKPLLCLQITESRLKPIPVVLFTLFSCYAWNVTLLSSVFKKNFGDKIIKNKGEEIELWLYRDFRVEEIRGYAILCLLVL
jgi:hypothetical protein